MWERFRVAPDIVNTTISLHKYFIHSVVLITIALAINTSVYARVVYYAAPESAGDYRNVFPLELLDLAFSKMDEDIDLIPNQQILSQTRALNYLKRQKNMDVVWTITSIERENNFLPVRIPIYKGLIGWRIPLISAKATASVVDLESLRKKTILQGTDWPDRLILEYNGIKVLHSNYYSNLFTLLTENHADYFFSSIAHVWSEVNSNRHLGIKVEQDFIVKYPSAYYFFVHKENTRLANIIRDGLGKCINDGSFDKAFMRHLKKPLSIIELNKRTIIQIENPLLPPKMPISDKHLWFEYQNKKSRALHTAVNGE